MHALILAAGYGTRLGEITRDTAKPLIAVAGRPLLSHIVEAVTAVPEVDEIAIITNDRFYDDFGRWLEQEDWRLPVRLLNDGTTSNDDRLGAIGDLALAEAELSPGSDLLLVGGDNLFRFSLADFCRYAQERGTAVALHQLPTLEQARLYGNVELDTDGRILSFIEKPAVPLTRLIATCVYYLRAADLARLTEYRAEGNSSDAPGNLIRWLCRQTPVFGYVFDGDWFDIGDRDSLHKACEAFAAGS